MAANALVNGVPTTFYIEEITDEDADERGLGGITEESSDLPSPSNENELLVFSTLKLPSPSCSAAIGGGSTLTLINDKLYCFGGCNRTGQMSSTLRCFDVNTKLWLEDDEGAAGISSPPSPRFGHSTVANDSKLYLFGGQGMDPSSSADSDKGAVSFDTSPPVSFNDLYSLDTTNTTLEWTVLDAGTPENESASNYYGQTCRPMPRNSHSAVVIGSKMYVFGGANAEVGPMDDLWSFDLEAHAWEKIGSSSPGPEAREMHAVCSIPLDDDGGEGGKHGMLIMGGRRADGTACQDLWTFEVETKIWRQLKSSGGPDDDRPPRCSHTAVFVPEHSAVAFFGGWDCAGTIFDDLDCFDIQKEKWVSNAKLSKTNVPQRFAHAACSDAVGSGLYIFGGVNAQTDLQDLLHLGGTRASGE